MRAKISILIVCGLTLADIPRAIAGDPVYTDNVVIVLDGSGSMREQMRSNQITKLAAAKIALHEVLAQLPETTHVGLLAFSKRVKQPWIVELGPREPERLRQAIDTIQAEGGTPLGEFIKKGADQLLEQRSRQYGYGTYRLLVVTDGEASDAALVERYAPLVVARGITIDVIGVDMKQDHTLATIVHSYRRADDPTSLRTAIAEVFAEVSGVGTDDAVGEDAFELIAQLPPELSQAMILALATSGNEPIDTTPHVIPATAATKTHASPPASASRKPPSSPPPSDNKKGGKGIGILVLIIAAVVVVGALKKAKGG